MTTKDLFPFKKLIYEKTYVVFNLWNTLEGVWYLSAEIDPDEEIDPDVFREFEASYIFEPNKKVGR
jgi:hypothetical protein